MKFCESEFDAPSYNEVIKLQYKVSKNRSVLLRNGVLFKPANHQLHLKNLCVSGERLQV